MELLHGRQFFELSDEPESNWTNWQWQKRNSIVIHPNDPKKERKLKKLFLWIGNPDIDLKELLGLAETWSINVSPHLALQLYRLLKNNQLDWYNQMLGYILPTSERGKISIPSQFDREGIGSDQCRQSEYPDLPWNISRLYYNRVVVRVSTICAASCQFCFRQHDVSGHYELESKVKSGIGEAVEYIKNWNKNNPDKQIRDVVLSGGDPLSLSDERIREILSSFKEIEGVELLRIDTKYPAVLPQRITSDLVSILQQFHPLIMNLHFTHPGELCLETKNACEMLSSGGIMLGSHTPLLRDINDDRGTLKTLFWNLLLMRVRAYYLISSVYTPGTEHFRVPVEKGLELIKFLEADLSGPAHPHYILYTIEGGGKVHLQPQYLKERRDDGWIVDTWKGPNFYPDSK